MSKHRQDMFDIIVTNIVLGKHVRMLLFWYDIMIITKIQFIIGVDQTHMFLALYWLQSTMTVGGA